MRRRASGVRSPGTATPPGSRRRLETRVPDNPWPALWAMVIGFFMILLDTTIVSVANPAIKEALDPTSGSLANVVWVTSAYLLAYAVPLLITGRLGDRFGPRRIYLTGLVVFTGASMWCGLSGTLQALVLARAVQGLGAAMMTPQTMAVITRTFPRHNRGAAMGLWGATAGVATLVGPLAGGLLVEGAGWEWIFFINVPVGLIALVIGWRLIPDLPTTAHRFDLVGITLSTVGLFLLVYGLQEAEHFGWGQIWGPISIWLVLGVGVLVLAAFAWSQRRPSIEPLVPLRLFRDRNFSVANIGIAAVGFTVTGMTLPLMFFLQLSRGLSPMQAALIMTPMAVISGVLAPFAGRLLDRTDPRFLIVPGLAIVTLSLVWFTALMTPTTPIWLAYLASALMGIGQAGMWGPLATTANRNLPPMQAGAGSGVYNTTRTVGSVLGSAAVASIMQNRLVAQLPDAGAAATAFEPPLPAELVEPFARAMAQSMVVPIIVLGLAAILMLLLERPTELGDEVSDGSVGGGGSVDITHPEVPPGHG